MIFSTLAEPEDKEEADFLKENIKAKKELKKIVLDVGNNGFFSKIKKLNKKKPKTY